MSFSMRVTSAPKRAACVAAWLPPGPPPMITKRLAIRARLPGGAPGPRRAARVRPTVSGGTVSRMAKQRFTAEVVEGAVDVPDRVIEALGGQRVPVRVTVNRFTFATTTAVMRGRRFIGFNKTNR